MTTTTTTTSTTRPRVAIGARAATAAALVVALSACSSTADDTAAAQDPAPAATQSTAPPTPPADPTPPPATTPAPAGADGLEVSGAGIAGVPFGTDAAEATAVLTERLGKPDVVVDPTRYSRIEGEDGWFERAGDNISPSWDHEFAAVSCWGGFCAVFGGARAGGLTLRGWELADHNRWDDDEAKETTETTATTPPDVRLDGSGITLGDSWEQLHQAYPRTVVQQAEGASLAVARTPWPGIFDGAAGWRLSGYWDYDHPQDSADGSVVTRLSGGEAPEPGCC